MSPEQASGSVDVDGRSDVYSLGCVTYEMLVGEPPYSGRNAQAIIAKVLTQPVPSVREGRQTVTPAMETAVHKALARLPADRFATADQFSAALRQSTDPSISGVSFAAVPAASRTGDRLWKAVALAASALALGAVVLWAPWNGRSSSDSGSGSVYRLAIPTGPLAVTGHAPSPAVALSPDGSQLAYVSGDGGWGQIYVRHLGSSTATAVPGAQNAQGPFFSPDGEWLGFVADGQLTKVRLSDGTIVALTAAAGMHGASWGADGTIVFGATMENAFGLSRIPAEGGTPETVLSPADSLGMFLVYPSILPDGDGVLFTRTNASGQALAISVVSLSTGELTHLVEGGGLARYVRTGHLLYSQAGGLYAMRFDADERVVEGASVRVVQDALVELPMEPAIAHFAISTNGTLVYLAGEGTTSLKQQLVWVDREGQTEVIPLSTDQDYGERRGSIFGPRLSPDGQRVVFWSNDPTILAGEVGFNGIVWVSDLTRGTLSPVTSDSMQSFWSIWSPDGQNVVSTGGGMTDDALWVGLFSRRIDGAGPPVQLTSPDGARWQQPYSFTADGSLLLLQQSEQGVKHDLWVLPLAEGGEPWPFLATPVEEYHPAISPDGRWLAYVSQETGREEIYVADFPEGRTRRLVSVAGGSGPAWTADGLELFYIQPAEGQSAMISVRAAAGDDIIQFGRPRELFRGPFVSELMPFGRMYDVTPDGQRFLMVRRPEQDRSLERVVVVLNWLEEVKSRVGQ
jgi:serine/threonine-protein kinase